MLIAAPAAAIRTAIVVLLVVFLLRNTCSENGLRLKQQFWMDLQGAGMKLCCPSYHKIFIVLACQIVLIRILLRKISTCILVDT
jgi:hypothetical protein